MRLQRGDIIQYIPEACYSKQGGKPYFAVVLSNDMNNKYSSIINVALISSSEKRVNSNLPVHVKIELHRPSVIMLEQLETIDVRSIIRVTNWYIPDMEEIDNALAIQLGLTECPNKHIGVCEE